MSNLFSLIKSGQVHIKPDQKIIPKDEFTVLVNIEQLLQQAESDILELRSEAKEEASRLHQAAIQEGFQEGLKQLNEKILELDQEKKRLLHEMNKLILPLALKAAKKIVAKELDLKPETIVDIVLQALSPVFQNRHVTIYVHSEDKKILETQKQSLKEKLEQVESLSIQTRDDIEQGGCIIQTESGIVNATVTQQWAALEAAFDSYFKSSEKPGET